jgi:membrane AbrB-like protein
MWRWPAMIGACAGLGWLLDRAGVPSSYLFAALLLGLAVALARPGSLAVPPRAFTAAQAVTGVTLGAYLQSSSLRAVADDWLPVTLISAATLAVCIAAGLALARLTGVDRPTATLGMVAGGASGIVAMAGDLGGDDRLVAFMQYARVLVVVLLTPLLAGLLFPGHHAGAGAASQALIGGARDWGVTIGAAALGALAARAVRLPAGSLLGPMILAGAVTLTAPAHWFSVPALLSQSAFAVIGAQVGLRFTVETVRQAGRLLAPTLAAIGALLLACFALAIPLHLTTSGVSLKDAYLATTPGGLYAVLAVAFGANANTTFILAVQGLRLLVMVLLAPVVVRGILRRRPG